MVRNRSVKEQARKMVGVFTVTSLLWLPPFSSVMALDTQELRIELKQIESKRKQLETQRLDHERDSRDLRKKLQGAEVKFRECKSGRWRVAWNDRVKEVEQARKGLEGQNSSLIKLNKTLRQKNSELKKSRIAIERRRAEDFSRYSVEFMEWLNRTETEYLWPMENELFAGYLDYHHGISNYIDLVSNLAAACENDDYGPAIVEKFETHLADILALVAAIVARRSL